MANESKTAIVTGASQGIGAALVKTFLKRGYTVVATSRDMTKSRAFVASDKLALVDGDIGQLSTAANLIETATSKFRSIYALINNASIFFAKPFTSYTAEDFRALASTNLEGFIYVTQLAIKQMLAQKSGGSIVSMTTTMADHPIAGVNASVPMVTKGGIQAITRSLAIEYAKDGIRVNAVAPGVVDTPMHKNDPKDHLKSLSPLRRVGDVQDCRRRALSHGGSPGNWGGAPRRWWRTCGQMVTGQSPQSIGSGPALAGDGNSVSVGARTIRCLRTRRSDRTLSVSSRHASYVGHEPTAVGRLRDELDVFTASSAAYIATLNALAVVNNISVQ